MKIEFPEREAAIAREIRTGHIALYDKVIRGKGRKYRQVGVPAATGTGTGPGSRLLSRKRLAEAFAVGKQDDQENAQPSPTPD